MDDVSTEHKMKLRSLREDESSIEQVIRSRINANDISNGWSGVRRI